MIYQNLINHEINLQFCINYCIDQNPWSYCDRWFIPWFLSALKPPRCRTLQPSRVLKITKGYSICRCRWTYRTYPEDGGLDTVVKHPILGWFKLSQILIASYYFLEGMTIQNYHYYFFQWVFTRFFMGFFSHGLTSSDGFQELVSTTRIRWIHHPKPISGNKINKAMVSKFDAFFVLALPWVNFVNFCMCFVDLCNQKWSNWKWNRRVLG